MPPVSPDDSATPREKRNRLFGCLAVCAVLLAGCSGVAALTQATDEPPATNAVTPEGADPVPPGGDVTAEFLATQWGQQFQGIVMDVDQEFTDNGLTMHLEADTNLVDPRGSDGSAPALQAVEICEALKSAFRDDWGKFFSVYVNEADGTVFATNKAPGNPGCAEY